MSSWAKVALSDVAEVFNGKTPSKAEQRGEGHPVLKIRDVSEFGKFRGKHESFVDPLWQKNTQQSRFERVTPLFLMPHIMPIMLVPKHTVLNLLYLVH